MTPASEILPYLKRLTFHCAPRRLSEEQLMLMLEDYVLDLQKFTAEQVQLACSDWRASGETKFPTSGQLVGLISKRKPKFTAPNVERIEEWRDLSTEEYERLSLREKIRHHKIHLYQANEKAGPMWKDGRPATADELPAKWHHWKAIAQHHGEQINRLQSVLARQDVHA